MQVGTTVVAAERDIAGPQPCDTWTSGGVSAGDDPSGWIQTDTVLRTAGRPANFLYRRAVASVTIQRIRCAASVLAEAAGRRDAST